MSIKMNFYNDIDSKLKRYVKFLWHSGGEFGNDTNNELKLLPMDHMDLVIRQCGDLRFIIEGQSISPSTAFFQGLNTNVLSFSQRGSFSAFGISFTPWGLYAFVNKSIDLVMKESLGYKDISFSFIDDIIDVVRTHDDIKKVFLGIESVLLKSIQIEKAYLKSIEVLEAYINSNISNVSSFCDLNNIHRRKLERDFKTYIGVSPSEYRRIKQFEETSRYVLNESPETLTGIGQLGNYYDQSHFIKNFKKYTDHTPNDFKNKKPALKSKIKFE